MIKLTQAQRKTLEQFLRFCVIGGFGFLIDYTLVHFAIRILGMRPVPAGFFSFPFAVTFTWAGNRFFTYHDVKHEAFGKQLVKFAIVCGFGLVFNRGIYSAIQFLPPAYAYPLGLPYLDIPTIGLIAGTAVSMFFNFFVTKKLVFR